MARNGLGGNPPGTSDPRPRKPLKIKLATHFGVGAASVGDIIAVKGHQLAQDFGGAIQVWNQKIKWNVIKWKENSTEYY